MRDHRDLRPNVRKGMEEAWYYIKIYLVQAVLAVFAGGFVLFRRFPLLIFGLLPLYLVGGLAAGAIAGKLLPWCRSRSGAAATGVVAALPFCFALTILLAPGYGWSPWLLLAPPGMAILYGSLLGLIFYRSYNYLQ